MIRIFRPYKRAREGQMGFTLLELVVALMVSAILIVGTMAIFRVLVVNSVATTNQAIANLQVHYVDYWIAQDVVQAGNITLGSNSTMGNFPLIITIPGNVTWGGNSTVVYNVESMQDKFGNDLWRLSRTKIEADGTSSNSTIAEYLLPWADIPPEYAQGNKGTGFPMGNTTLPDLLVLQVGALVDNKVALASYEINPRVTDVPTPAPTPTPTPTITP
jgi:prepilin-type N-terminal cleavage/methylation domain-containing protein